MAEGVGGGEIRSGPADQWEAGDAVASGDGAGREAREREGWEGIGNLLELESFEQCMSRSRIKS